MSSSVLQPFVLSTVEGKHQDLKYITADVVSRCLLPFSLQMLGLVLFLIGCHLQYETLRGVFCGL